LVVTVLLKTYIFNIFSYVFFFIYYLVAKKYDHEKWINPFSTFAWIVKPNDIMVHSLDLMIQPQKQSTQQQLQQQWQQQQ
jgi:hypothetical protein